MMRGRHVEVARFSDRRPIRFASVPNMCSTCKSRFLLQYHSVRQYTATRYFPPIHRGSQDLPAAYPRDARYRGPAASPQDLHLPRPLQPCSGRSPLHVRLCTIAVGFSRRVSAWPSLDRTHAGRVSSRRHRPIKQGPGCQNSLALKRQSQAGSCNAPACAVYLRRDPLETVQSFGSPRRRVVG